MGLDGAMDFEVDNGVEPIAPELSGAAQETEGMAGLRDNWAARECFLDEERHLSTPEGIAHWWGPDAGPVLVAEADVRVGGRYRGPRRRSHR